VTDHQDTKAPSNVEGAAEPRHLDGYGRLIVDSAYRVDSTLGPGQRPKRRWPFTTLSF
jgi:hypothetical protein